MKTETRIMLADEASITQLQRLFDANPDYFRLVTGKPARKDEARSLFQEYPPGNDQDDIVLFGFFLEGALVGVLQFLQNYPDRSTIFLGLLLIDEQWRCKNLGRRLFSDAENSIAAWKKIKTMRLAVFEGNDVVLFWERLGFVLTGERKLVKDEHIDGYALMMEKALTRD